MAYAEDAKQCGGSYPVMVVNGGDRATAFSFLFSLTHTGAVSGLQLVWAESRQFWY